MCTVTFIPKKNGDFILTSNRDELPQRETLPPAIYKEDGIDLLYPKDVVAGGTWIGLSSRERLVCLLNGGFVAHTRKPYYPKSRGLIVKELLIAKNAIDYLKETDFTDMEPFTIIMVDWQEKLQLYQLVWDGEEKHLEKKNIQHTIWNSAPLYTPEMTKMRKEWFSHFLDNESLDSATILNFHRNAGVGDKHLDLQIDRGFLKTVSITQIEKKENIKRMYYNDLQKDTMRSVVDFR